MKKSFKQGFILLLGLLCISMTFTVYAYATNVQPISFTLNGKKYTEPAAEIINNQVMIPISFVKRAFQMNVGWNQVKQTAEPVHYSNRVAVLMYHHLMKNPTRNDIISEAQFDKQMSLLKSNGFHVIGLKQYMDFMHGKDSVPDNAVLITFDDGYESFYDLAFPILKKYKYAAVNFVIVSTIDNPEETGLPKLHWYQMREMQQSGIDFMNHTYNLHDVGVIDAKGSQSPLTMGQLYLEQKKRPETIAEYKKRLRTDLSMAEKRLQEELGNTYSAIAFPYGKYNKYLLAVMKELKIDVSFTVNPGVNTNKDKIAYRINAGRSDISPEAFIQLVKAEGESYTKINGKDVAIMIDDKPIIFSKATAVKGGSEPLVSLSEFCRHYNIQIKWDPDERRITLLK